MTYFRLKYVDEVFFELFVQTAVGTSLLISYIIGIREAFKNVLYSSY